MGNIFSNTPPPLPPVSIHSGGIVGYQYGGNIIIGNSSSTGNIFASSSNAFVYSGGIVGYPIQLF